MAKRGRTKRMLRYLGRVGLGIVNLSLLSSPVGAVEETKKVVESMSIYRETYHKMKYTAAMSYLLITCIPAPGKPVNPAHCFATGYVLHGYVKTIGVRW